MTVNSLDVPRTFYSHLGNRSQIRSACPTFKNAKNFGQAIYFQEYDCTELRRTKTVPQDIWYHSLISRGYWRTMWAVSKKFSYHRDNDYGFSECYIMSYHMEGLLLLLLLYFGLFTDEIL